MCVKINIKNNHTVFVQQHWIKKVFEKSFYIQNIKVAIPEFVEKTTTEKYFFSENKIHFFYPSIPKSFKNIELIFEAIKLLGEEILSKCEFHITGLKNNTDKYATFISKKYNNFDCVNYLEILNTEEVNKYYNSIDCLIFPSKIETWGLPITEAKAYNKPLFLANKPYAKETCGNYDQVSFFNTENPKELAKLITEFVNKTHVYQGNKISINQNDDLHNWSDFYNYILNS